MANLTKPLIGITCGREFEGDAYNYVIRVKYFDRIKAAGGIPVLIADETEADALSGVLFTGGGDFAAETDCYGGVVEAEKLRYVNPWRDTAEARIYDAVREKGIRVLGICRGMQAVNVFRGGTLHYDIPSCTPCGTERHSGVDHEVQVQKDSLLSALLQSERITVNSFHHQAVAKVGEGLSVIGKSPEGIIEALYGENTLLVQWHPERMDDMQPLFDWLCKKDA